MYYLSEIISTKNGDYLYDAVTNQLKLVPDCVKQYLRFNDQRYEKEYIQFLEENNLRDIKIEQNFNIKYYLTEEEIQYLYENKMMIFTLVLTEKCNMRCEYCAYMSKYRSDYCLKDMTDEIAFKAIDLFARSSMKNPHISLGFYGGEPLLKFDLIKKCIKYYKENYWYNVPNFSFVTNGLLINDEISDYLIDNEISVHISFDGPKNVHDKYRLDVNKDCTHHRVLNNLNKIYNKSPEYFRKHISFNTVLIPNENYREIYDYLDLFFVNDISLIDVNITPYFQQLLQDRKINIEGKDKNDINYTEYTFLYDNMLKSFKRYRKILGNNFLPSNRDIFPGSFCIPGVRKNLVTVDGSIIVCERVDETKEIFKIGDVFRGIDQNRINFLFSSVIEELNKRCSNCWAIRFCSQCFSNVFCNHEDFCLKEKKRIINDLKYYVEYILPNNKILNQLDNMTLI